MKWLHNILKGASFATALFIFQACYGVYQPLYDEYGEAPMTFSLVSQKTGEQLENIKILGSAAKAGDMQDLGTTGADGRCSVILPYLRNVQGPYIRFQDPEGIYFVKDTTLADLRNREIVIKLESARE